MRVRGNSFFPSSIFSRFHILLAILRQLHLLLSVYLSGELTSSHTALSVSSSDPSAPPNAFFVDQLSAALPLLYFLYPRAPILFYCHFPDLLLASNRAAWWRRLWRVPFDALEGWSMRAADRVVVNSRFTRDVVRGVWGNALGDLGVVYPCVEDDEEEREEPGAKGKADARLWGDRAVILSINRYERKKDIGLAIRAFAGLDAATRERALLVIAGMLT